MSMEGQPIETISNYKKIDAQTITGGQPSEEQLRAVAAAGFEAVVNLSTNDPRYALPDEAGLVQTLGMQYHYLPVQWDVPMLADFDRYVELMEQLGSRKVLVHCAANYRVSAFYALYAMQKQQWSEAQVDAFIAAVWQPSEHPQWQVFIDSIKQRINTLQ